MKIHNSKYFKMIGMSVASRSFFLFLGCFTKSANFQFTVLYYNLLNIIDKGLISRKKSKPRK
jgi:hypothetical protein